MPRIPLRQIAPLLLLVALALSPVRVSAADGYRQPPQEVVDIITATPAPRVSFSPDRTWMVWRHRAAMPSIEDVSRRMLRLAGTRIDPVSNGRFRTSYDRGFEIRSVETGDVLIKVALPDGEGLSGLEWSHHSEALIHIRNPISRRNFFSRSPGVKRVGRNNISIVNLIVNPNDPGVAVPDPFA